jgi:hypothetical protein
MQVTDPNILTALKKFSEEKRYIEAPFGFMAHQKGELKGKSIFLGGGISNCDDWQSFSALSILSNTDLRVFNPRRFEFDIADPTQSEVQITWEFVFLNVADVLIFWFPKTSVCPITLFEYGKWLGKKKIYLGVEPGYTRKFDLELQSQLELGHPVHIYSSISDLVTAVINDNK